jgi:hypothetical protein
MKNLFITIILTIILPICTACANNKYEIDSNKNPPKQNNNLISIYSKEKIEAGFDLDWKGTLQTKKFMEYWENKQRNVERNLAMEFNKNENVSAAKIDLLFKKRDKLQEWSSSGKYSQVLLILTGATTDQLTNKIRTKVRLAALRYIINDPLCKEAKAPGKPQNRPLSKEEALDWSFITLNKTTGCSYVGLYPPNYSIGEAQTLVSIIVNRLIALAQENNAEKSASYRQMVEKIVVGTVLTGDIQTAPVGMAPVLKSVQEYTRCLNNFGFSACSKKLKNRRSDF